MNSNGKFQKVILAAGGIVERVTDQGVQIAVIHRSRYGGEWNLPKGKLDEDESPWDAAIREVKEETGCQASIDGWAGFSHYYHGQVPKFVLYWRMTAQGECNFKPSEEVDKLEWLTPEAARRRLTHANEIEVVSRTYDGGKPSRRDLMMNSLDNWWSSISYRLFGSPKHDRLANAVCESEIRLKWRLQKSDSPNGDAAWGIAAQESLAQARVALQEFNFDRGWQLLHLAQTMEIWGYGDEELSNNRKSLCEESAKLRGWRAKTISQLVCHGNEDGEQQNNSASRGELYQATMVRNEQFSNLYHKILIRGRNLRIAFFTLAVAIILLPLLAKAGLLWATLGDWKTIAAVELTGILGASFSVASSLTKSSIDESIPQQILGSVITWMRPVMGAAAAVVAVQLFQAEVLPLTIKPGSDPKVVYFVIAFIAGFSERFIIGAIGKILPREKET